MTFKQFRERAGMTQNFLADVTGVSVQQIRKIEQNPRCIANVSFRTVELLWYHLVVKTDFDFIHLHDFETQVYLDLES